VSITTIFRVLQNGGKILITKTKLHGLSPRANYTDILITANFFFLLKNGCVIWCLLSVTILQDVQTVTF
jgi:hypothetical protein